MCLCWPFQMPWSETSTSEYRFIFRSRYLSFTRLTAKPCQQFWWWRPNCILGRLFWDYRNQTIHNDLVENGATNGCFLLFSQSPLAPWFLYRGTILASRRERNAQLSLSAWWKVSSYPLLNALHYSTMNPSFLDVHLIDYLSLFVGVLRIVYIFQDRLLGSQVKYFGNSRKPKL